VPTSPSTTGAGSCSTAGSAPTSRASATDDYGKVDDIEELREAMTAYEKWLLDVPVTKAA
jgi:hypothetical protein